MSFDSYLARGEYEQVDGSEKHEAGIGPSHDESQIGEVLLQHPGLLDISGRPLLYSPAFCRVAMDFISQRPDDEFMCGG